MTAYLNNPATVDSRRLTVAGVQAALLQLPQVQLEVRPPDGQRLKLVIGAPLPEAAQVTAMGTSGWARGSGRGTPPPRNRTGFMQIAGRLAAMTVPSRRGGP